VLILVYFDQIPLYQYYTSSTCRIYAIRSYQYLYNCFFTYHLSLKFMRKVHSIWCPKLAIRNQVRLKWIPKAPWSTSTEKQKRNTLLYFCKIHKEAQGICRNEKMWRYRGYISRGRNEKRIWENRCNPSRHLTSGGFVFRPCTFRGQGCPSGSTIQTASNYRWAWTKE